MIKPDIIYNCLSKFGYIESPQKNIFKENDKYSIPIHFSFRFDKDARHDNIYHHIEEAINNFDGELKWIFHNMGSNINYTIEPFVFFKTRLDNEGKLEYFHLKDFFSNDEFKKIIDSAIADLPSICITLNNISSLSKR